MPVPADAGAQLRSERGRVEAFPVFVVDKTPSVGKSTALIRMRMRSALARLA